jgi:hypothetical protein
MIGYGWLPRLGNIRAFENNKGLTGKRVSRNEDDSIRNTRSPKNMNYGFALLSVGRIKVANNLSVVNSLDE